MKNIFLSAAIFCSSLMVTNSASAQFNYALTSFADTYTPLTGATSVTNGSLWTSDSMFVFPIGFTTNMNGISTDTLHLLGGGYVLPEISAVQTGWVITGTSMSDRGIVNGVSKSDIRYQTTGTPGSRIFKMEVFNAGFEEEYLAYGDLKDSISFQMWVYETSNVVEFRYGSSNINYPIEYFGNKMLVGMLKDVDTSTGNYDNFYVLNGTCAIPTIDSFVGLPGTNGLSDLPQEGRVFRFTFSGNPTSIKYVTAGTSAQVYPTMAENIINVDVKGSKNTVCTIMNSQGQILKQTTISAGKTAIDVFGYAAGLYTLSILNGDGQYEVHKFVKM